MNMGVNNKSGERRANKRYKATGYILEYEPDSIFGLFSGIVREYIVLDISQTGIQFLTQQKLKEKSVLMLKIDTPYLKGKAIHAMGRVVWVKDAPKLGIYAVGVKFTAMSEQDSERLNTILEKVIINKIEILDIVDHKELNGLRLSVHMKHLKGHLHH